MDKRILNVTTIFFVVLFVSASAFAYSPPIENGISWLSANQNADGSWGNNADLAVLDTSTVLDAFQSLNVSTPAYLNGITWLSSQSQLPTDFLSRKIVSLYTTEIDISTDLSALINKKNMDGGWSGDDDPVSMTQDTALGLQALKAVNYPDLDTISSALFYLTSNQNADGGFGSYAGDDSTVYMTAVTLNALLSYSDVFELQSEINNAVSYLLTKQNPDGSFGEGTVYETALSFIALIESGVVGAENYAVLQNAIAYLTSTQLPNGSWNDDPYSTALALRALANVKPNLSIASSDITFSNQNPTVGETITVTATVHNIGLAQAENVSVQFYDGDPNAGGVLIGEATIASIPAYEDAPASINWTIQDASTQIIYVLADPLNSIDELDEEDNSAARGLTSATLPDLSISPADISFSPQSPAENEAVVISATIRNIGETIANSVTLKIYDGDPSGGGILISNMVFTSIPAGNSITHNLTTNFAAGEHDIYVLVDSEDSIIEGEEANNIAMRTLPVGMPEIIDLLLYSEEITFTPAYPTEGDAVTINAVIRNEGTLAAANVLAKFYLGDPDAGGMQIGSDINISSISARGTAIASTTWDSTGHEGNNNIYVVIDPDNTIIEESEENNKDFKTIIVAARVGPDLTLSQADINYTPVSPISGDMLTITANIRNIGVTDASNVPVEFSLGDPEVGGTLIIGSQTIPFIAQGGSAIAQITWDSTRFTGDYEIFINADPFNEIPELIETNNRAHTSVTITAPQGPDITIPSIDTANLITDTQSLQVSGSINLTLENKGNQDTASPFAIIAFEDSNGNETLDRGIDNILGETTYSNNLIPLATDIINIPLSGDILFRDNLIYVAVDSNNAIEELSETNNMRNTGQECEYIPPVGTFNPVQKWAWTGSSILPAYNQVMHLPVVARIIDTNGDGVINDDDVPAIIFQTFSGGLYQRDGVLRAVRGDNGEEIFTVTDPALRILPAGSLAVGDIDNDGLIEIIAPKSGGGVIAFEHDGTFKWNYTVVNVGWGGPSLADIDNDGLPEIIIGATVLNSDGTLRWKGTGGTGNNTSLGPLSLAADIDLDGVPEVVAGNTVYKNNGSILWRNTSIGDGFNAVANFDDDPYAEIVLVTNNKVYLFEHNGIIKWGPVSIPSGGRGGAPTISDFDGDGEPEIGVAAKYRYVVFDTDGSILWQSVTQDGSSNITGSSVFDFDGDGQVEVVYNDEKYLRIYKGSNGQVLFSTPNSSGTTYEYPLIVDVDNDNRAEIAVAANDWYPGSLINGKGFHGIRVFEDAYDNWVNTRKIWNQHTYHITNVNDNGTIPRHEQNNWEVYNNYRCNSLLPEEVNRTSDITASYITIDQTNYPAFVTVSARIGNGGAVSHPAGVEVKFYDGDPLQGGILLGTTSTTQVIEKVAYEDVSVLWNAPFAGEHNIYAVADEANEFNECREGNNTANALLYIGVIQPPAMPDLEISQSDITIIPAETIEGQTSVIKAVIHNIGTSGASDVIVSFYDGDPQSGGILIGSVTVPLIDAGADASAEITWNTMGQTGTNYIHVEVDEQNLIAESNENNNSAIIIVDVIPPTIPDLTITSEDIVFSHQSPNEGDPLAIAATIHNLGTDAGNIKVNLYDGAPQTGGTLLKTYTISQIIPFGGSALVTFNIDTAGFGGAHSFYVVIDPDNTIIEQNEENNTASSDIFINSIGLGLTEITDKTQYTENENVLITVALSDLQNESRELIVDVKIFDSGGFLTASLPAQPITLNPHETRALSFMWNTGSTLIGSYSVTATAYNTALQPLARYSVPIAIVSSRGILTNLVTDKISYYPNETTTIVSTISNDSLNQIYGNLTAAVSIRDFLGNVLYTENTAINILTPSSSYSFNTYWNTSTNPPGDYPVTLEVKDSTGNVLSTSTKNLTIESTFDPKKLLTGQISVDKQSVLQGEPIAITYGITNIGNVHLAQIDLSVLTVHVVELTVYDTLTDQTALLMGATYTNTQTLDTQNYSAKDYLVILRANVSGIEETLASTYFRVEGAPSAPSLNWPSEAEDIETLTPSLTVNNAADPNDDDLTYEFELYSDSGLVNLLSSSDMIAETQNITSWAAPFNLTENNRYYWRARAYDGVLYGDWMTPASFRVNLTNAPPTAPILSSPADDSDIDTLTPLLVVNNAFDPDSDSLTYNFELALDIDFAQIISNEIGIFEGEGTTSWQVPITLNENTYYYWRAQADDWLIEGPWMIPAGFFINTANDAPTAPVIIYPSNSSEITFLSTDITVTNSTDPDSENLTYVFEIDTVNTFDSPNIIISGNITEGEGTTSLNVSNLNDNTFYYVRAKASDGLAESQWSEVTSFFVNTLNDAPSVPILSNPSDGGAVNALNPELSIHNSTDIDGDILTYEFELYEDEAMTNLISSVTGMAGTPQITSWRVPINLTENQTYYWRARAYDGELYSGWMIPASFMVNTANDAPYAPTLHSPAEGSSVDTLNPALSINNAIDPDSDVLTYDFEIYSNGVLIQTITGIPQNLSGITSAAVSSSLSDNTVYNWRARAYDGDRYGAWMDMASFSIHLPVTNITGTIDFDPDTLNQKSQGKWVVVYIELPQGYNVANIIISSIRLEETIPAEPWPYNIGDNDKDGIPDLMVKFKRADVINLLPAGDNIIVHVKGMAGTTTFEGFDIIRVIH